MATLDTLITARDQIAARIVDVTANPTADFSENGRSVSGGTYLTQLIGQLEALDMAIARLSGPFEVQSLGRGGGCYPCP